MKDAGKISHELMLEIVEKKFEEYQQEEAVRDVGFDEVAFLAIESAKRRKLIKKLKGK